MPTTSSSRPLLLLGMHRSGTSALARALGALGFWLGSDDQLLPAHAQDNPRGYWERRDVLIAHDRYLHAIGCDWDRLSCFPEQPGQGPAGEWLRKELKDVVAALDGHGSWIVKDPRLCLLLPVWRELVPDAAAAVAVRHPLEIAASLLRTHRGTYPTPFLLALWEKYMLRMLKGLRGRTALFVSYRRCMEDTGAQMRRLLDGLVAMGARSAALADIDVLPALFESGLRRQRIEQDVHGVLTAQQSELLLWLERAAAAEVPIPVATPDWREPDAELAEFEASFDARIQIGRSMASVAADDRLEALRQALAEMSRKQDEAREELGRELASLRTEHRRLRDDHVRQGRELRNTAVDLGLARSELAQTRARAQALEAHAGALERGMAELKSSLSWRVSAPLRWLGGARSGARGTESRLFRLYYRLPGLNTQRKRALIVWLHEHASWLTRRTVSYQLYQASKRLPKPRAGEGWLKRMTSDETARVLGELKARPLISILMPAYNTEPKWLHAAVDSVRAQTYPNWQLCIADDASPSPETQAALSALNDPRIKLLRLEKNVGIAAASNAALAAAEGEYIALLDHDDELAPDALLEVARRIDADAPDFLYSDEDKLDYDGQHVEPHFKPDFSPDYFLSSNYLCHLAVMRRDLLQQIGGFRTGFDGAQDYDLFLRYVERCQRIEHIPQVLYHWRKHEGSTAAASEAKPKSWDAGQRALSDALDRRGIGGRVELGPHPNTYHVRYRLTSRPLLSVVVPFRDKPELLETCVEAVLRRGGYENVELLAVDNGSVEIGTRSLLERLARQEPQVRVLRFDAPFNYSSINNWAVNQSKGDVLLLLNNDIEAISAGWIEAMLEHAQRPEVGVVGARLLYPDDTVQHAGVIVGLGGVAGHSHLFQDRRHPGYFARSHLVQNLSAVTFACAMMRRSVYEELGGLNESDLAIAFNDIDFCLRARERDYLVVYTPYAELYHHESKSRGGEDTPEKLRRFNAEIGYMQRRHRHILERGDPYYSPHLSLHAHRSFTIEG